jgi:hypothetical protein
VPVSLETRGPPCVSLPRGLLEWAGCEVQGTLASRAWLDGSDPTQLGAGRQRPVQRKRLPERAHYPERFSGVPLRCGSRQREQESSMSADAAGASAEPGTRVAVAAHLGARMSATAASLSESVIREMTRLAEGSTRSTWPRDSLTSRRQMRSSRPRLQPSTPTLTSTRSPGASRPSAKCPVVQDSCLVFCGFDSFIHSLNDGSCQLLDSFADVTCRA